MLRTKLAQTLAWCLLSAKHPELNLSMMMEVVVTSGAVRRAKVQSYRHHQQTNTQLFYRPNALPVAHPTVAQHWRKNLSHSKDLLTQSSSWGLTTLSLTTKGSWLPWGRVAMPLISPLMPVPYFCYTLEIWSTPKQKIFVISMPPYWKKHTRCGDLSASEGTPNLARNKEAEDKSENKLMYFT